MYNKNEFLEILRKHKKDTIEFLDKMKNPPEGFVLESQDDNPIESTEYQLKLIDLLISRVESL